MTMIRSDEYWVNILEELRKLPSETTWVAFEEDHSKPEEIGEYISALANAAALAGRINAYMIWGIDSQSHDIIGTTFKPEGVTVDNEKLANWLTRFLLPKIHFYFYTLMLNGLTVVLLEVNAAFRGPVRFKEEKFICVGLQKKNLKDYLEKERHLWRIFNQCPFEKEIAAKNLRADDVLRLLDYPAYFDLVKLPHPDKQRDILNALKSEKMVVELTLGNWHITNLGVILFAKRLSDFKHLACKAIRVIQYKGTSKLETICDVCSDEGYAVSYETLMKTIMQLIPSHEIIEQASRKEVTQFPELAIRALIADAMIHQDLRMRGSHILVELLTNRIEITTPGSPLVDSDRCLDYPPTSRNEAMASFMKRIGIYVGRVAGINQVVVEAARYQLPPPVFSTTDKYTVATLFAHKGLK